MKRKFIALMLSTLFLVSCGNKQDENKKQEPQKQETVKEETKKEEKKEETKKEEPQTTEENGVKKTVVFTNKELNQKGTVGPINYNISKVQVSKMVAVTDMASQMLDVEKGKEFTVVAFDIEAENTSDEDVTFFVSQATLITNTKEQVEANMIPSKYIDGEFLGKVKKKGTNVYLLKETKSEDLKSLELRISSPSNKNFENFGDEIKINVEVK